MFYTFLNFILFNSLVWSESFLYVFKKRNVGQNYIVLYCIDRVVIAVLMAQQPLQDLLCSPDFRYY